MPTPKPLLPFLLVLCFGTTDLLCPRTFAQSGQIQVSDTYGRIPLHFEANQGQADVAVRFFSRGKGYGLYFAPTEVMIALNADTNSTRHAHKHLDERTVNRDRKVGLLRIKLEGSSAVPALTGEDELECKTHYFIGSDPIQWRTNVSNFGKVRYQGIYPGIDLVFYGNQRELEYDFVVAPGADPNRIALRFEGANQSELDAAGDLVLHTASGEVRLQKPVLYQEVNGTRQTVEGRFQLRSAQRGRGSARDRLIGFEIGEYDQTRPLVIDPVLSYSTFLGGSNDDRAWDVAVDAGGNAYVIGQTLSVLTNLITPGAFQTNYGGGTIAGDAFVAKINPSGSALVYMTYLGGNDIDVAYKLALDGVGNAFVCGTTRSTNFPTLNAFRPNIGGPPFLGVYYFDGFVTKLNTNGSALVYSTYLGGTNDDNAVGIAVDASGSAYVTGFTQSSDFPRTNAIQNTFAGVFDAYVTKFNSSGSALVYSTYHGGSGDDRGQSIAVDAAGNAYVGGLTASSNLPTTNALQATYGGGAYDGFVFKLNSAGNARLFSTYIGGSQSDSGYGISLDAATNIYLAGQTFSANFPTTNALQALINGTGSTSSSDGFVTKMNSSGSTRFYSTFIGGSNNDDAWDIKSQSNGDVIIVGQTGSIDFAPYNNYGSINLGAFDAFVAKLNSAGSVLMNFAYLGGTNTDYAFSSAIDVEGNAYVVGMTASGDFPTTGTNVVKSTYGGGAFDAFITKLYFATNQLGTRVLLSRQDTGSWSNQPSATLTAQGSWSGAGSIPSTSTNGVSSLLSTRFQRGASYDPTYTSFIIPLDFQKGIRLDDTGDNTNKFNGTRPWFTRLQKDTRWHLSLTSSTTNGSGVRTNFHSYITNFDNPVVAFGSSAGLTPLYANQSYRYALYCGEQYESTNSDGTVFQAPLRVLVYRKSDFVAGQTNLIAPIATNTITLPRRTIAGDQTAWSNFATNGYTVTIEANGLRTTAQLVEEKTSALGVVPKFANARSGPYVLTHLTTNPTNCYVVEGIGVVPLSTNLYPMVTNANGTLGWDRLYAIEFDTRPPWRSIFVDAPQFDGSPLPSFYQGKSAAELSNTNFALPVTNVISLSSSIYTNLNNSPELRRHPILDKFVTDLAKDPIALANYVVNEIELTDAIAYNENGQASASVVNQGGVNRGALAVFQEGQGSPAEQCALMVYLLRQAGYPAAYVFPTNSNVKMLDTRLSKLLRMQVKGAVTEYGQTYTTNSLITLNYPWVVTTVSNSTVHIFPWLKETELVEGLDLYSYLPTNYNTGYKWLRNYLYGDTNILALSTETDAPSVLFPKFVKRNLLSSFPGISVDDLGTRAFNRPAYYARWRDFPTPSIVTNQSQVVAVDTLTSTTITNVSPALTNLFNTVTIELFSLSNTNNKINTGPLRLADLHNRKMFATTNSTTNLMLWLAPFRPDTTNQSAFTNDPALTNKQIANLTLTTNDQQFAVRTTFDRHRSLNFLAPTNAFLGVTETLKFTTPDRPFMRADLTAICMSVGRVTPAMLDVHARAYRQMDYQRQLNTNTVPAVEDYQGAAAYLMGMDYYAKVSRFTQANEQLHKARVISWLAQGLSKLTPIKLGTQNLMRPSLDMFFNEIAHAGNGTIRPDSGNDFLAATDDFSRILMGEIAAQEHNLVNGYYRSTNAVSAVTLLRLAQQRSGGGVDGIVELNKNNYLTRGNTNSAGYGPNKLKDYDTDIWSAVTNAFLSWDADYVRAFITPGPVPVQAASFRGMGLVVLGKSQSASLISLNMNGVLGEQSSFFALTPATLSSDYSASYPGGGFFNGGMDASAAYGSYLSSGNLYGSTLFGGNVYGTVGASFYWVPPSWFYPYTLPYRFVVPVNNYATANGVASFTSPSQIDLGRQINDLYFFPSSTPAVDSLSRALDGGNSGLPTSKNQNNFVSEPVSVLTGEFYHDEVDLTLPGPMTLELRRNYSSQNQSDRNNFGYGWNINLVPYLTLATTNSVVVISAVEPDGSVIAYRQQSTNANLFIPLPDDNLTLDNNSARGIGSVNNPFNARIVRTLNGTNDQYKLTAPDGQTRLFEVNAYPVVGPTNTVTRQRPYLKTWQDAQSNSFTFTYGIDSTAPEYGHLVRIQSSSGNFLGLAYNAGGYVTETFTGDGRRMNFEYDDFGDLTRVAYPDASEHLYEYQHNRFTNSGTIYVDSTHLMTKHIKPDGRILENVYDNLRRVITQKATVGVDLNTYTNATFVYSNNFTVVKMTNGIWGFTQVKDFNNNTTRYDYTNSLVTQIDDPINPPKTQEWYFTDGAGGAYRRSLKSRTDPRGLKTEYKYDGFGNATNLVLTGDLTGHGITNEIAAWNFTYTTNNLIKSVTDPANNQRSFYYHTNLVFSPETILLTSGGTSISSNRFEYYNVTNGTAVSRGLLKRLTRAVNSPDSAVVEFTHDARGFPVQSIQFTGQSDPNVTNNYVFNGRGEMIETVDGANRTNRFAYDARGRLEWQETLEDTGQRLAGQYMYYNPNGELTWSDGPRFDPEDYVWRDYDGAGRMATEMRWRSRAKYDGTGVEAETGDDLYATRFLSYDKFNNLTNVTDPFGNYAVMKYDAIGQLTNQVFYSSNNVAMATNRFGYEPGGLVKAFTNALGGVTSNAYTWRGQLKRQDNSDGSFQEWRYDLSGRVTTNRFANSNYLHTVYDDSNRRVTNYFKTVGSTMATNIVEFDRRGNLIRTTDVEGFVSTNLFDGLDRLKIAAGPAIISIPPTNAPPAPGGGSGGTTNQQVLTYLYDAAGKVLTVTNGLGEKTVLMSDALGRPTRTEFWSPNNERVRVSFLSYAPNHHSVTVTNGSSYWALLAGITYTDNDGQPVLSVKSPTTGVLEYLWQKYDRAGRQVAAHQLSKSNSVVTMWATNGWTYDGLNRALTQTSRDGAAVSFAYDALGSLTSRGMPNALTWSATYLNDGKISTEKTSGGGLGTLTNTYQYYPSGNQWAGLLKTVTDGRNTTRTNTYDNFLRVANVSTTGALAEQQTTTTYQYDRRSLLTNLLQSFASTNTGPSSSITRAYDGYGQLLQESVLVGGVQQGASGQSWDRAGRRAALGVSPSGYFNFAYQADGQMTLATDTGLGYYDNGLLSYRVRPGFGQEISARDGTGRILQVVNVLPGGGGMNENLTWRNDGLLNSYTITRPDFTDTRNYSYSSLARRLTQESLNVASSQKVTNSYAFDLGTSAGLGVLTSIGMSGQASGTWSVPGSGGLDGLRRVAQEQNTVVKRAATGKALGAATVAATLDTKPVGVTYNGVDSDGRWRCLFEMPPGSHTLRVSAAHPSGQFTAYATNVFTLSTNGFDTTLDQYDGVGNVTQRVWKNASGTTNRTQALTWDAFGRLLKVTERDAQTNGFNWIAVYDALGRRLRTTTTMVLTNVLVTSPASAVSVVDSYFDPEVEFLEVGVSVNGVGTWKSHGPDIDQNYGGVQGVGGLDYVYRPNEINPTTLITDVFGNAIGSITDGTVSWNPARVSSYGPLPGYPSPALSANVSLVDATAWRGRRVDQTGLIQLGARYYDPVGGRFISADPLGHSASMDLFSFCDGQPVTNFDPTGRLGKPVGSPSGGGANIPAWLVAATAQTCMDCHGNIEVLMGGYMPYQQPWFDPNGNNAYASSANWFQPRAGGFVKVSAGIAGMAGSGFLEGGSYGLASPIALPAFAGSSALYASGLRQIVNGDSVTLSQQLVKRGADPETAALFEFLLDSSAIMAPGQYLKGASVTPPRAPAVSTSVGRSNIRWIDERAAMNDSARMYDDAATGAQSSVATQSRQVPVIEGPGGNVVKFDGLDGMVLIDRKTAVTTFRKSENQAFRQFLALQQNGLTARWEVTTQAEANRAIRMLNQLGINNITVIVVPK